WSSPLGTVRIGADGELPARRIDFARDGRKGRFELLDGDWAQLRGAFRELHPQRVSWHAFVGQLLEGAAAGEQASGDGVSATLLAVVLEGGPDVWAAADGEPKELVRAPREDAGLRPIAVGRGS